MKDHDIYKAAAVIIRDRRLLVTRTKGKDAFVAPGGKLEGGETPLQALQRELKEELQITIRPEDTEPLGTFYAQAAYAPDSRLRMDVHMIRHYQGELKPAAEVDEIAWITTANEQRLPLGSIFEHDVLPKLKAAGLID